MSGLNLPMKPRFFEKRIIRHEIGFRAGLFFFISICGRRVDVNVRVLYEALKVVKLVPLVTLLGIQSIGVLVAVALLRKL